MKANRDTSKPARREIFVLTPEEKRTVCFVLIAFVLGLATKYYRDTHPAPLSKPTTAAREHRHTQTSRNLTPLKRLPLPSEGRASARHAFAPIRSPPSGDDGSPPFKPAHGCVAKAVVRSGAIILLSNPSVAHWRDSFPMVHDFPTRCTPGFIAPHLRCSPISCFRNMDANRNVHAWRRLQRGAVLRNETFGKTAALVSLYKNSGQRS